MVPDPRRSNRYMTTRRAWLAGYAGQHGTCCMCGQPVDTSLPGTHRYGPTIEHRLPIRTIRAQAQDWAHAVAIACDTSLWALAHNVCQARQGQRVTAAINKQRNEQQHAAEGASRRW